MNDGEILNFGQSVMRIEAEGILQALHLQRDAFVELCHAINKTVGKIVVTGVGKAGIIGKKISATLASTGSPSIWLDPMNALHGDLGMVDSRDLAILISNSGTSNELLLTARALKGLGLRLCAMTRSEETLLAKLCDITVSIGDHVEACPLKLAPSTSTTVLLSLGDAVALTVQKIKQFKEQDYAKIHPAGALGRRLATIRECMRSLQEVALATLDTTVFDAVESISRTKTGICVVVDEQSRLVGVFSEGDFRRAWQTSSNIRDLPIRNYCNTSCIHILESLGAGDALDVMTRHSIIALPVVNDQHMVKGLVLMRDII